MLKIALAPPPLQNSPAPVLPQAPSLAAPVLPQALSLAAPVLPQALAPANDRLFPNDRLLAKSDYPALPCICLGIRSKYVKYRIRHLALHDNGVTERFSVQTERFSVQRFSVYMVLSI